MGELQAAVSDTSAQGGSQEFLEYYEQRKGPLISLLQNYAAKLNSFYATTAASDVDITQLAELRRQQMLAQIEAKDENEKSIRELVDDMLHRSGKGGADIMKKGLQKKFAELTEKNRRAVYEKLSAIRNKIYNTNAIRQNQEQFKVLVLEGMRLIYKIREDFTGEAAENIAITFAEAGYAKTVIVPMDAYLAKATEWTRLSIEGFSKELAGDPFKLQMKKSQTIIDQLIKMSTQPVQKLKINGTDVTLDMYKELKKNIYIYREDKAYFVVTPGQGGFVAEALVRAQVNGAEFQYRQDREAWYQEADVIDKATGQGISVKNFLDSSPTLLRINSLHTVVNELIGALSSNLPPGDIVAHIRQHVFHATGDIDTAKEQMLEKLVSECLGI